MRMASLIRTAFALAVLVSLLGSTSAGKAIAQPANESGEHLAMRLCAPCHAIGASDRSPIAAAPPLRHLEPQIDLDDMQENLRRGLLANHPDMPAFVLTAAESRALVLYLKAIRAD